MKHIGERTMLLIYLFVKDSFCEKIGAKRREEA